MAVKFGVTTKKDPRNPGAEPKYYAIVKSSGRDDLDAVAQKTAEISTASPGDTALVLENFISVLPKELAEGKIVELGGFGTFRLSVSSDGAATADDVTARSINDVRVIFSPGKRFQQILDAIVFQKEAN